MASLVSVVFVLGPLGAGKGTLCTLLAEKFPVQHISVGDLLRRIKDDTTHPQAGTLASLLNKQKLIDAKVLIPILKNELEGFLSQAKGKRVMLVDGFPRNLAQQKEFEEVFADPRLVLFFNCPKEIAKQRYLTRNLEGRESDDETTFEQRHNEYVRENEGIVCGYRERGLLMEIDTGKGKEESWDELCNGLERNINWTQAIHG